MRGKLVGGDGRVELPWFEFGHQRAVERRRQ